MPELTLPLWMIVLAIAAAFALGGILVMALWGVISFLRSFERGRTEFTSSMPSAAQSPLDTLDWRFRRGEISREQYLEMYAELERLQQREADERRRFEQ